MREQGKVVAFDDQQVWLETGRQTACESCSAQKGCGSKLLEEVNPSRSHVVSALRPSTLSDIQIGQSLEIEIDDAALVSGSALVYLLPLFTLLLGAFLGDYWFASDAGTALGLLAGLAAGFGMVRLHYLSTGQASKFHPHIVPDTCVIQIPL